MRHQAHQAVIGTRCAIDCHRGQVRTIQNKINNRTRQLHFHKRGALELHRVVFEAV